MNYGEMLKNARKKANLSQKDLAEKLDVHQATISVWEKSHYPPLEAIEKVCKFLDVEMWEFFVPADADQNDRLPSYIKPEQAELMRLINTNFDAETRIEIWDLFHKALEAFAVAAGVKVGK